MKKIILSQFILLLAGTLFAWFNFIRELIIWMYEHSCEAGCSVGGATNPFLTPCFYGALFFTVAFILSAIILKKSKNV